MNQPKILPGFNAKLFGQKFEDELRVGDVLAVDGDPRRLVLVRAVRVLEVVDVLDAVHPEEGFDFDRKR